MVKPLRWTNYPSEAFTCGASGLLIQYHRLTWVSKMARIRTVKPEFWTSEQITECSPIARLLFIGMWNFCDDGGNLPASIKTLKMLIFPSDEITQSQIQGMIDELINTDLLVKYMDNNKFYWHVTGWNHQKIEKPTYKYPAFNNDKKEDNTNARRAFDDVSTNDRQPFDPVMEGMGNGMDFNKKNNASANYEKPEQAQPADDEPAYLKRTPNQPHQINESFKMFIGWQPEPALWAETLKASRHLTKDKPFTDYNLAEFIRRNVGTQDKTEINWQRYYVNAFAKGMLDEQQQSSPSQQGGYQQKQQPPEDKPLSERTFVLTPDMGKSVTELGKITEEEKVRRRKIVEDAKRKAGLIK